MNTKTLIIGGLIIILVGGAYMYFNTNSAPLPTPVYMPKPSVVENNVTTTEQSRYQVYSKELFDSAKEKKRVYFFHAAWCPTCKIAHEEITGNPDGVPQDVVVFKTDYDTQTALKKQYAITYQHTFVLVDENGKEITKWNGGGLTELTANTK